MKRFLQASGLFLFAASIAATSPQALAQAEITGRVYQVSPNDVYVEMADHTAVRVPNDTATFILHGAPVDVTDLRRGDPVIVQYNATEVYTPPTYRIEELPPAPRYHERIYRDTVEDGVVVHHVWYHGAWHRL